MRAAAPDQRSWWYAVLSIVAALLVSVQLPAQERIVVGVYQNSPKVGWNDAGKPEGIFIDLVEKIALEEGWTIEYVPGTWGDGLQRLSTGEIDLMPDVALTPEREALYAFHREPVLSSWTQVYTRRGSGIRSLPDLADRRVAVVEGSMQQDLFQQMIGAFGFGVTIVPFPDFAAAFRAVSEQRADAVVTNRFYGARHAPAAGLEDTAIMFAPSRLYFAAPRGSDPARLAAIDRHLLAFKRDSGSVYYRTLREWTSDPMRPAIPRWLKVVALASGVLLAAAAAWLVLLRRQVATRTAIIHHRNEQLAIVNRTLRAIGSSLQPRTVLEEATRGALALTGCDYGMLCVLDPEAGELVVGARVLAAGTTGEPLRDAACPPASVLANLGDRPGVFPAAGPESPLHRTVHDTSIRWHVAFPLEVQGEDLGLLCLYSVQSEPPPRRDVNLVQELCVTVALVMENSRLYGQAREHALELEDRVEERTSELAEAKHAAESADRLKSAFLATMSHELRTPLNSIIGFTGIVVQELAGPLNDEQKRQLGMVRESAQHLLALINDVLDISKIEAGEFVIDSEPFDLAASIQKVAGIVAPLAAKKRLDLTITIAQDVQEIVGDVRRVEQILLNLLGNAIKFTRQGSVGLTARRADDTVTISVSDTGIGIEPEEMKQLFQPFRQIDSTLSRKHEGTGLGLAICRRLADLMGGRIEAESEFGKGSVFSVTLPVRPPEAKQP